MRPPLMPVMAIVMLILSSLCTAAEMRVGSTERVTAASMQAEATAYHYKYRIRNLLPHLNVPEPPVNGRYFMYRRNYPRLSSEEKILFMCSYYSDSCFNVDWWLDVYGYFRSKKATMEMMKELAKADPKAWGDVCWYHRKQSDKVSPGTPSSTEYVMANLQRTALHPSIGVKVAPAIDIKGYGVRPSLRNTYIPDSALTDVFAIYGYGCSFGEMYWIRKVFPHLKIKQVRGQTLITLEQYYLNKYRVLSERDRVLLTILLLSDTLYIPGERSELNNEVKRTVPALRTLLAPRRGNSTAWRDLNLKLSEESNAVLRGNLKALLGRSIN